MSSSKVSVEEFASAIMDGLIEYRDLVAEDMKAAVDKTTKAVRKQIKASAPRRPKGGKYAKSWAIKKLDDTSTGMTAVVYSRQPGLPHLLENGHALRQGGRAGAHVHIAPAEEAGIKMFEKEIEKAIKQ